MTHTLAATEDSMPHAAAHGETCGSEAGHHHGYITAKDSYLRRLRRIEGQARGLQRMVDEEKYCIDILTQISAMKSALENVGTYAKQIELSASVEIHHADSSRGTIELLPSLPSSSFIHIDPYEIDKKGDSGVTYLDILIQATQLGMKCLLWYGFMTEDDKESLDNYIVSSLEKAGIKDYIGVELTMNSIRKDSILCNPGILGSGILSTNVSQASKDIILDYSNQLVDIYKDAKYKDYDGSLYIQHL